jgi:O-antigen/teichoic acid export membrane protein
VSITSERGPRSPTLTALRRPLLLSLANQLLGSGANFLVGLYLARNLALAEFGLYGICYGICMLYIGVGNAMLLTQMTVSMAGQPPAAQAAYAGRVLASILLLGSVLLLAGATLAATLWWWRDATPYLGLVAPVALAAALMLCGEFFSTYAYIRHHERAALLVNAAALVVVVGGLALLHVTGGEPDAASVLLLYAGGNALGAALAYVSAPLAWRQPLPQLHRHWRSARGHGGWSLGGVAISWVQAQSATYTLAAMLGPAGAGLANLSRLFISPFTFLVPAVNKIALPRLAALRASDPRRMRRLATQLALGMVLLAALYAVLLLSCLSWLAPLVLGYSVPQLPQLVAVWCLVLLFQVGRSCGGLLLQMQMKFRQLTLITLPCAVLAVSSAVLLMQHYQAAGAIAGVLAGEGLLALLIWKEIAHGARTEHH